MRIKARNIRARRTRAFGVVVTELCAISGGKPRIVTLLLINHQYCETVVKWDNWQVGDISRRSEVSFCYYSATRDDPFAFCDSGELSCCSPPISPRVNTTAVAAICTQGPGIVDLKHSTILYGSTDECVFEMKGKTRLCQRKGNDVSGERRR